MGAVGGEVGMCWGGGGRYVLGGGVVRCSFDN